MAPLVRRGWARRGQPPELAQRSGHREKVSLAGALWLSPRWDRLGLFFRSLVNDYFNNHRTAIFLEKLLRALRRRVVVVWDGGSMHKGDPIKELLARTKCRLCLEKFPPYAPELLPVEQVWTWLKYDRLCNFAPQGARHLNRHVWTELLPLRDDQVRLRNFFHASELSLPQTLFF